MYFDLNGAHADTHGCYAVIEDTDSKNYYLTVEGTDCNDVATVAGNTIQHICARKDVLFKGYPVLETEYNFADQTNRYFVQASFTVRG
jgi:hypothetical protein